MQIELAFGKSSFESDLILLPAYSKAAAGKGKEATLVISHWPKDYQDIFKAVKGSADFKGDKGDTFSFIDMEGTRVIALGMGEKSKVKAETLRRETAKIFKAVFMKTDSLMLCLDAFNCLKGVDKTASVITESLLLSAYSFDKYRY